MKTLIEVRVRESLNEALSNDAGLKFNSDGRLNKTGPNTIYMGSNPIVDFGIGEIGTIDVNGKTFNNSLYLRGGFNSSQQKRGYGKLGLKFIFDKLPKIENLILQCYDNVKPFWTKMGGQIIDKKQISGNGKILNTMVINRSSFS